MEPSELLEIIARDEDGRIKLAFAEHNGTWTSHFPKICPYLHKKRSHALLAPATL
jgi:hypothetical protein